MKNSAIPSAGASLARRCLLAGALALCMMPAFSQQDEQPQQTPSANEGLKASFGVKGGANWSDLWIKDQDLSINDRDSRLGFNVGVFARFASEHALGVQLEALYDQKGTTVHYTNNSVDQETTYKFDYVTVPLLVVIPLGEVLELHAGGYGAYMVTSEVHTSGDLGEATFDPADSKFNGFDYGLVGGVGINLGMAQIGARYEHGLGDITDNNVSAHVLGTSHNAVAQVYLALALGK